MKHCKALSILLTLAMLLALLPVSALAAPDGTVQVGDLDGLIDALAEGGSVELTADIAVNLSDGLSVPADVEVELDLNGHCLNAYAVDPDTDAYAALTVSGTLTLYDSSEAANGAVNSEGGAVAVEAGGELLISACTLTGGGNRAAVRLGGMFVQYGGVIDGGDGVGLEVVSGGKFYLADGTIRAATAAVCEGEIHMYGGVLQGAYTPGEEELNALAYDIDPAELEDEACGVCIRGGSMWLGDGEITGFPFGVCVEAQGEFEMESGKVSGCLVGLHCPGGSASVMGGEIVECHHGVYLGEDAALDMSGGTLYGNSAVNVIDFGTFTLTDGEILGGRVGVDVEGGSLDMSGGSILFAQAEFDEEAGDYCCGIGIDQYGGSVRLTGGSVSYHERYGVAWEGALTLSGSPVLTENVIADFKQFADSVLVFDAPLSCNGPLSVATDTALEPGESVTFTGPLGDNAGQDSFVGTMGLRVTQTADGALALTANEIETVGSDDWAALAAALAAGHDVTLDSDVTAPAGATQEDCLTVPAGAEVTLDLNGHRIDAGEALPGALDVYGVLRLCDGSEAGNGAVASQGAVTVFVEEGGALLQRSGVIEGAEGAVASDQASVTLSGGKIVVNGRMGVAADGGSVRLAGTYILASNENENPYTIGVAMIGGVLELTDGVIRGTSDGVAAAGAEIRMTGGLIHECLRNGISMIASSAEMSGGWITDNAVNGVSLMVPVADAEEAPEGENRFVLSGTGYIAQNDGNGVMIESGTMTMTGGQIAFSVSDEGGDGVEVGPDGVFEMSGGAINSNDYGVYVNGGSFTLSGDGAIYGNGLDGVDVDAAGRFVMTGGEISYNEASGVFVEDGSSFTMLGGDLGDNTDEGVWVRDGSVALRGGSIHGGWRGVVAKNSDFALSGDVRFSEHDEADVMLMDGSRITLDGALERPLRPLRVTAYPLPEPPAAAVLAVGLERSGLTAEELFASADEGWRVTGSGDEALLQYVQAAEVGSWTALAEALQTQGIDEVRLTADLTAETGDALLSVPAGRTVTLDLAGHSLDAEAVAAEGAVLTVEGELTLSSSGETIGSLTGGNCGVLVQNLTETETAPRLILRSGAIDGCDYGVSVLEGEFEMHGGEIKNCREKGVYLLSADFAIHGGGVRNCTVGVDADGSDALMTGGIIHNHSDDGVKLTDGSSFVMTGGVIRDNWDDGVSVDGSSLFRMEGGGIADNVCGVYALNGRAEISGGELRNDYTDVQIDGGTVAVSGGSFSGGKDTGESIWGAIDLDEGELELSGAPEIHGRAGVDLWIEEGLTVNVTGELRCASPIVTMMAVLPDEGQAVQFTRGLVGRGSVSAFASAEPDYVVIDCGGGEAGLALAGHEPSAAEVGDWESLRQALLAGGSVRLADTVTAAEGAQALVVPEDVGVTLDLNGMTLDCTIPGDEAAKQAARMNNTSENYGIRVLGSLILTDGSAEISGVLTGDGTGILADGGSVLLQSGSIRGCLEDGVHVNGGSFFMTGGAITDSVGYADEEAIASCYGCGVGIEAGSAEIRGGVISGNLIGIGIEGGSVTMSGGVIADSRAVIQEEEYFIGGVGVILIGDEFVMTGGTISGCPAGGLYVESGVADIRGGELRDNSQPETNGGIFVCPEGTLRLSGSPVMSHPGSVDILLLRSLIHVTGPLTNASPYVVYVYTEEGETQKVFTEGLMGNGTWGQFVSVVNDAEITANEDGEAVWKFGTEYAPTYDGDAGSGGGASGGASGGTQTGTTPTDTQPAAETVAYTGVPAEAWYADAAAFAQKLNLFGEHGEQPFNGDEALTRGDAVRALWVLAGKPEAEGEDPAIAWAASKGILQGTDAGYALESGIDREQLCVLLYRYLQQNGRGFTGLWSFRLDYPDAGQVSAWADEAMHYLVMEGILNGMNGALNPQGEATKAQTAALMQRIAAMLGA